MQTQRGAIDMNNLSLNYSKLKEEYQYMRNERNDFKEKYINQLTRMDEYENDIHQLKHDKDSLWWTETNMNETIHSLEE